MQPAVQSWVKWNRPVVFERREPGLPTADHLHFYPMKDLFQVVIELTRVGPVDLRSDRRSERVVKARMITYWLMRHYTRKSLPLIGRFIGNRHHTTILHGIERADAVARLYGISAGLAPEVAARRLWAADWPAKRSLARH